MIGPLLITLEEINPNTLTLIEHNIFKVILDN